MEHGEATIGELLWPALNFVLFVGLLVRFLRGPVREYFRARHAGLRDALAAGARARREAEAVRAALAHDLADLPAVKERLRGDLRAAAEQERDRLRAQGRTAAERIRNDARLLADHEVEAARQALRAEVVDEAVRQATAILCAALRAEDQERLVRDFLDSVRAAA